MARLPPSMRRVFKIVAVLSAIAAVTIGVSLFSIYEASQLVPEFYHEAISSNPERQVKSRDQFVAQATALASDVRQAGRWQSLFTAEQINSWLSLELASNYPDLLPEEMRDPRISFRENEATIACRYESGGMAAVLSLTIDAYLHEPNVLALRIRRARAGALPVPLAQVLDGMTQAARELKLRLEWRKIQGDPVALIDFGSRGDESFEGLNLQTIELRDGELFVAGAGNPRKSDGSPAQPPRESTPTVEAESVVEDQPMVGAADKDTRQK